MDIYVTILYKDTVLLISITITYITSFMNNDTNRKTFHLELDFRRANVGVFTLCWYSEANGKTNRQKLKLNYSVAEVTFPWGPAAQVEIKSVFQVQDLK